MFIIDLILNLAGLLLWLSWQALGINAATRPTALSLVYTLKRAEPHPPRRRTPLLFLLALLVARSVLYWQLGPAAHWHPRLNLGVVTLDFPNYSWSYLALYSFFSFGQFLGAYYLTLLLIAVVNSGAHDNDPLKRIVRMQLGLVGRLPVLPALLVPFVAGTLLWLLAGWPLGWMKLLIPVPTLDMLWQQALIFGLGTYLVWQYAIIVLCVIHLLNSYVYLGNSPIWHFLANAGRNSLLPVRWIPLTFGRLDLAPILVIGLAFLAAYHWPDWGSWLFALTPW